MKNCHNHKHRFWKMPFIVAAIVLVKGSVTMLLWNALIPDLFHGPTVTFLQALGLVVLAKVLVGFGGGGHGRFGGPPWGRHWRAMSQEERDKIRGEIRKRFEGEVEPK